MRDVQTIGLVILIAGGSLACTDGGKGEEDNPFNDEKADSFFSPTQHGELVFGSSNQAEITSDELFHAWSFTLTGDAEIALQTEIEDGLDTVMYLYRRDIGSTGSWGRFLRKNDDHDGEMFSRIEHAAEAGEYRVLVKGFKESHRGAFAVAGECEGDGCPERGACLATDFGELPAGSGFSEGCAEALVAILAAPTGTSADQRAEEADVCALPEAMKRGVDLYRAYWEEVTGWEEFKSGEEIGFDVTSASGDGGSQMLVDTDFDEDAMTFLFDGADDLVLLYQHNQSPDVRWFCATASEEEIAEPGCLEDMLGSLPHRTADISDEGSAVVTCGEMPDDSLPLLVGDPVCEFTAANDLADDEPVEISFTAWRNQDGLLGAEVRMSAGGSEATYHLGTTFSDHTVIFAVDQEGSGLDLPCLELM